MRISDWSSDVCSSDLLILRTGEGHVLALNDPRRFGSLDLVRTDAWEAFGPFTRMGPEPLSAAFDGRYLAKMFKDKIAPVKAALLDQRIVAGLGNIYVCEALHLAGIEPVRASGRIGKQRLERLAVDRKSTRLNPRHQC